MMKNIIHSIKLWWKFEGRYYHKDFINGVKNIIYWIPVIWKDRDYDHNYIYEVLKAKLEKQAKFIGERNLHTRAKRDAEIMLLCVRLIEKIQEEFYQMEYSSYNESEIYFVDYDKSEGLSELKIDEKSERYDEYFRKYPIMYKKILAMKKPFFDNSSKKNIAMNISLYNQKRASDLLWKIVNENINKWWD